MPKRCLALFLICLSLWGCSKKPPEKYTRQIFAMDTVMDLTVYTQDPEVLTQAQELIGQLETMLSVTDPESQIAGLNKTGHQELTEETAELIRRALQLCEKTQGALDLSIYPVVRAWGFTTGNYQIPGDGTLERLLQQVDYRKIRLQDRRWITGRSACRTAVFPFRRAWRSISAALPRAIPAISWSGSSGSRALPRPFSI